MICARVLKNILFSVFDFERLLPLDFFMKTDTFLDFVTSQTDTLSFPFLSASHSTLSSSLFNLSSFLRDRSHLSLFRFIPFSGRARFFGLPAYRM